VSKKYIVCTLQTKDEEELILETPYSRLYVEDINAENRNNNIPRDEIRTGCQRVTKDEKEEEDIGDQNK
jgi:hypothetical protein